mmetsp:Transcript_41666/g.77665  ORF Transcript_41666/g.77665 Transcript_41666/m.77665 type:complete len:416 (-) Transcript_41666:59-1306(-)
MMAMFRQHNHLWHVSSTCLIVITTQHMMWTANADRPDQEATTLDAAPHSLLALKETLDSKLSDGMAGRPHSWADGNHNDKGEHRATANEDQINHNLALLQNTQEVHRVFEEFDELEPEASSPQAGSVEFYNKVGEDVGKLEPIKEISLGKLIDNSNSAVKQSKDTFNSFLHYVGNLERLIGGTWTYNDKLEDIHDGAISDIQSPLVEGNFPTNPNKPIQISLPLGGELHFQQKCPNLTPKSLQQLEHDFIPKLQKKITKYTPGEREERKEKKFLLCVKTPTTINDPDGAAQDANAGCQNPIEVTEGAEQVLQLLRKRQAALIQFLKEHDTIQDQDHERFHIGKPPEITGEEVQRGTYAQITLNVFNDNAQVSDATVCTPEMFVNFQGRTEGRPLSVAVDQDELSKVPQLDTLQAD